MASRLVQAGMRFGSYRFQPGWSGTLLATVFLGVFSALGLWQLDRAEQKTNPNAPRKQRRNGSCAYATMAQPTPTGLRSNVFLDVIASLKVERRN